jgi:hypothetical protein
MTLVGLNMSAQYLQWTTDQPPVSNFTLSPDKLEAAIAQTVAELTWMGMASYYYSWLCHTHTVSPIQQGEWDSHPLEESNQARVWPLPMKR